MCGHGRWPAVLFVSCLSLVSSWAVAAADTPVVLGYSHRVGEIFAHLTQASYCGADERLLNWTCGPCREAGLRVVPGSVQVVQHREIWQANSTSIYIARVVPEEMPVLGDGCVVSFRGSSTVTNWIRDVQFWPTRPRVFDWCEGCIVEDGFYTVWKNVELEVLNALHKAGCRRNASHNGVASTPNLFITGHSLGAAIATVAMCNLQAEGYDVRLSYIFESPRVGNARFAAGFNDVFRRSVPTYRVTHARDPVVHLPPQHFFDYTHVGYEAWYDRHNTTAVICAKEEDRDCADRYNLLTTAPFVRDHCANPLALGGDICQCPLPKDLQPSEAAMPAPSQILHI